MADAMDVDASQPRQFRLVKASGDAHVARLPPSLGARLFDDARAQLTEELESDVSEDEQDPDAKPNFRRRRRRFRGRKLRQHSRWRIEVPEGAGPTALVGAREGGVASKYALLRETAAGAVEVLSVKDWFAFRPPVTHATLNSEEVETAMAKDSVRYDVSAAARLQPWRRDQGQPSAKPKKKTGVFGRLAAKLEADDPGVKQTTSKGRKGGSRAAKDLFRSEGNEAHGDIDFGMNAAGGDRDEDIIEGRGDDGLDVEEDFQDDEADEEKHDLDGLFFRDDALSDDEVADDEDDTLTPEQRKAMKEQARKDREQAALLRGQAPTKRAWREAEHEEEKNKRRKVESTQMGQHSQAWDHTTAKKPTVVIDRSKKRPKVTSSDDGAELTEAEVRGALQAAGGRMKTKDLLVRFKARLKANPANKDAIRRILRAVADVKDDSGVRVLELKAE
jgi:hypothetical protein